MTCLYDQFEDIVENKINYSRITTTMQALNWTWLGNPNPPTVEEMKKMLYSLYFQCEYNAQKENHACVSSGGFQVIIIENKRLLVNFNVEHFCQWGS